MGSLEAAQLASKLTGGCCGSVGGVRHVGEGPAAGQGAGGAAAPQVRPRAHLPRLGQPMYRDWEEYRPTYQTYEADLEYVKFCVEMSEKIKWIEDEAALLGDQRMRNELVAYFQSLKIALQFRNISGRSVLSGFEEHVESLRFDFNPHKKDLVSVYLELWKRVAKKKVNLGEALRQLYEDDIFPSRKALIKYALDSYPDTSLIKYNYDTYVDGIDEKFPEDEARPLIMEAVKKMFKKRKNYLDYTRKKLEVAARIGLIPTTA